MIRQYVRARFRTLKFDCTWSFGLDLVSDFLLQDYWFFCSIFLNTVKQMNAHAISCFSKIWTSAVNLIWILRLYIVFSRSWMKCADTVRLKVNKFQFKVYYRRCFNSSTSWNSSIFSFLNLPDFKAISDFTSYRSLRDYSIYTSLPCACSSTLSIDYQTAKLISHRNITLD